MPKLGEMAQLSRPFQIVLVAVCVLAAAWVFALQGHLGGSGSSTNSSTTAPSTVASRPATHPASRPQTHTQSSTRSAHAGAPSTRAHRSTRVASPGHTKASTGARTSAPARTAAPAQAAAPAQTSTRAGASGSTAHSPASSAPSTASRGAAQQPIKAGAGAGRIPARQALVERALGEGKIAVILFWNPKASDDVAVNEQLRVLEAVHHLIRPIANAPQVRKALERSGLELQKKFAAFRATVGDLSSFGTITQHVQVAATPTLLIVNKNGQTTELTGLQDAFSIEQAIDESRQAQT